MNIAFQALLIFILVLPGVILRYTYSRGYWKTVGSTSRRELPDEIAYSVTFAIGLHVLWMALVATLLLPRFGLEYDLYSTLVLLSGSYGPDNQYFEPAITSISEHPIAISLYFLGLYALSGALGASAHLVVRRYKLDLKYRPLRFHNHWYYLLSGEVLGFGELQGWQERPNTEGDSTEPDAVYLSAVVDQGEESYLYRGIVVDWWYGNDGNPDRILLKLAHRRKLSDDKPSPPSAPPENRYHDINDDFLVLKYSEIRNMGLQYFFLVEEQRT